MERAALRLFLSLSVSLSLGGLVWHEPTHVLGDHPPPPPGTPLLVRRLAFVTRTLVVPLPDGEEVSYDISSAETRLLAADIGTTAPQQDDEVTMGEVRRVVVTPSTTIVIVDQSPEGKSPTTPTPPSLARSLSPILCPSLRLLLHSISQATGRQPPSTTLPHTVSLSPSLFVLVGPGGSGVTTILTAIEEWATRPSSDGATKASGDDPLAGGGSFPPSHVVRLSLTTVSASHVHHVLLSLSLAPPALLLLDNAELLDGPTRRLIAAWADSPPAASTTSSLLPTRGDDPRPALAQRPLILLGSTSPDTLLPQLSHIECKRVWEVFGPGERERAALLRHLLPPESVDVAPRLAAKTHGFVLADLAALARLPPPHPVGAIRPSTLSLSLPVLQTPTVTWDDVGGAVEAKDRLREAAQWPLTRADDFVALGIAPPRGVLLYGPPGTGKTLVAAALASEAGLRLLSVKGPELLSKWVGESERAVRRLFRAARSAAPCVIFFDELDALGAARGESASGAAQRVVSQLLVELDGAEPLGKVVVVGATNRPDLIDAALLRPGRFDAKVYLGPPDLEARESILKRALNRIPALGTDLDYAQLAEASDTLSGAELAAAVRSASLTALRAGSPTINQEHVLEAIERALPGQITPEMLDFYAKLK